MERVRVGVIGLGTFGQAHLTAYADHPGAELTAVCDLNEECLRAAAGKHGVDAAFTDYRELLAVSDLDAVSIVTPDFTHTDIVVAAIEAGKAVLVEKPLATTLEDCDRMAEALEANPVPFMVDFHNRWNPGVAEAKKAIDAGDVGRIEMAYHRLSDTIYVPTGMLSWAGQSGVDWFLASHCLDTLRWLLDDEVARIYSVAGSRVLKGMGIDTPDYYLSTVTFRGGANAVIENCWILPNSSPSIVDAKLELVGEKGTLYFDPKPDRLLKLTADSIKTVDTYGVVEVHGRAVGFCLDSIKHFVDCLLAGRAPMVGIEDGRAATQAILAMEESVRTVVPVDL